MKIEIIHKLLHFKQPAGTSRGIYTTRDVWYIVLIDTTNPSHYGVGECAPLPDLSCDALPNYEVILREACKQFMDAGCIDREAVRPYPSILLGVETAWAHYQSQTIQ